MAETYAIVESGGKQYRAEKGTVLVVDRLPEDEGAKISLRAVMFSGGGDVVANGGDLEKVKVEAKVAEHVRGEKLRIFKYKPKKGYRRRAGHRSELTRLEVTEVKMLSRKPASKAESKPKPKADEKPKADAESGTAKAPGTKEPAKKAGTAKAPAKKAGTTKKPAAKKPAAKASTAKKPAAKKAPAKKAGAAKSSGRTKSSGGGSKSSGSSSKASEKKET